MLKPVFEAVKAPGALSFLVRTFRQEAFDAPFHLHPEYELTLITAGEGKRYVGNRMDNFIPGDLVLLGANLPHCWKTEPVDHQEQEPDHAGAIVIQFTAGFLGHDFFSKPELASIQKMLLRSKTGIHFFGKTRRLAEKRIRSLIKLSNDFEKLMGLLQVLHLLALSEEGDLLAPQMNFSLNRQDQQRINHIFAYIIEHFKEKISLADAAQTIHMTPNALCKYFKKITRKTFMETVIEYRLNYAAGQLVQTDKPVSAICFDSGFGDVSHFNKTFKSKMALSPLQYRKNFMHQAVN